jgi:hypothetical protein
MAWLAADATLPLTAGFTSSPSPSSHTYRVLASANQMPKGYATGLLVLPSRPTPLASVVGNPGKVVIGSAARSGGWQCTRVADLVDSVDAASAISVVTHSVLLYIAMLRKLLSFLPCLQSCNQAV